MSSFARPSPAFKRSALFAALWLLALLMPGAARAAELLVVGSPTCPYCKAWEIQVGAIYGKTAESRLAPLRRIDISRIDAAPYRLKEPVRYTPTFVLLERDVEVGRIVGYADEATFWGLLNALLNDLQPSRDDIHRTSLTADPEY